LIFNLSAFQRSFPFGLTPTLGFSQLYLLYRFEFVLFFVAVLYSIDVLINSDYYLEVDKR
jgi:hypothetical protein